MGIFTAVKTFLGGAMVFVALHASILGGAVYSSAYHLTAYDVRVQGGAQMANNAAPSYTPFPRVTFKSASASSTPIFSASSTKATRDAKKDSASSVRPSIASQAPVPSPTQPTPKLKPSPIPTVSPVQTPLPTPTPAPTPAPSPTPTPLASSEIPAGVSIGDIMIGSVPKMVKSGEWIPFSVYVRDSAGLMVKNKQFKFLVNGELITASTDDSGNAQLRVGTEPGDAGTLGIIIKLGSVQAMANVEIVSPRPVIEMSTFAFTQEDYMVRLRNALGEYVADWTVSGYAKDGSLIAVVKTSSLGVANIPYPAHDLSGHLYICIEVKDIGRKCDEW